MTDPTKIAETVARWEPMADWSGLPDVYVTKAECQQGMFWRIEACSVPMAIGPEVRLVPAYKLEALAAEKAALEARLAEVEADRDDAEAWAKQHHADLLRAEDDRDRLAAELAEARAAMTNAAMYLDSGFINCQRCREEVPTKHTDAEYELRAVLTKGTPT